MEIITKYEKEQIQDTLAWLSRNFSDQLVLACVVDEKARLIDSQRGMMHRGILPVKYNDVNIKASLIFSLAKQFEDFTGPLAHSVITYDDEEVAIMEISGAILYVICSVGSAHDIVDGLTSLVKDPPRGGEIRSLPVTHDHDLISSDWSGR